jgi:hypothetical protein
MPGRIINSDDHLGILTGRIGAGNVPEGRRKRHLQALLFTLTSLCLAARRLLQQAGGQLPRHHIERGTTIDLILIIPRADGGTIALYTQRGP